MIEYRIVSVVTTVIAFTLCVVLLFYPQAIFILFEIEGNNLESFIGRRAAMLFLGISVLTWFSRNAVHSESRQAICLGIATAMISLALLGTIEYLREYAGVGIFLAIVTEFLLALKYFKIWLRNKNA